MKFKKGDKVRSKCNDKSYGRTGTIVYPKNQSYCVQFKDFDGHNGHNGSDGNCDFRSDKDDCWFIRETELELASEQYQDFVCGDEVEYIGGMYNVKYGKIIEYDPSDYAYRIAFERGVKLWLLPKYFKFKQTQTQLKEKGENMGTIEKIMKGQLTEDYLVVKENIQDTTVLEMITIDFFKKKENMDALIAEAKRIQKEKGA